MMPKLIHASAERLSPRVRLALSGFGPPLLHSPWYPLVCRRAMLRVLSVTIGKLETLRCLTRAPAPLRPAVCVRTFVREGGTISQRKDGNGESERG